MSGTRFTAQGEGGEATAVIARVARATRGMAMGMPALAVLTELLAAAREIAGAREAWLLLAPTAARVLLDRDEPARLLGAGLALAPDDGDTPTPDARLDRVLDAPRVRLLLRGVAVGPDGEEARGLALTALANLAASQVRRVVDGRALRHRLGEVEGIRRELRRAGERPERAEVVDPVTGLRGVEWYRHRLREELARGTARLLVGRLDLEPADAVDDGARRAVARALRDALRRGDLLARLDRAAFGFALVLPAGEGEAWERAVTGRLLAVARGALSRAGAREEVVARLRWRGLDGAEPAALDGVLERLAS